MAAAADRAPSRPASPGPVLIGTFPAFHERDRPVRARGKPRAGRKSPLIVLIDNYDSFTWNLAHLLSISGARVEVARNDEVTATQVTGLAPAGVLISPGPCAPAEAGISVEAVRTCATARIPLLGICLGHQAIAAAYGAAVVRAPLPVHGKAFPVKHDGRGVLAGLPHPLRATRYHSLIVDEATLPPELRVTAVTGRLPMGLRHVTDPVEGVQFHPESILTTHGRTSSAPSSGQRCYRHHRRLTDPPCPLRAAACGSRPGTPGWELDRGIRSSPADLLTSQQDDI